MRHEWPGNVRELKNLVERLTVRHSGEAPIGPGELPQEIRRFVEDSTPSAAPRVNPAETLFHQIVDDHQSFWTVVYTPFMSRDLTRETLRALVGLGLQHTSGSYRDLVELFHMTPSDYKRFLNFLRKHQCHMPFQQFRGGATRPESASTTQTPPQRPPLVASSPW